MYSIDLTVRGFHCDMFAHVNNARYLEYLEEARWEWLNSITDYEYFIKRNMRFVVVSVTIHYRYPATLNEVLTVTAETSRVGNRSGTVAQKVIRKSDNKLIADAEVTFALVDNTTGKSVPIDEELKALLTS
jgi:thioesterase-3